MEWMYAGPQEEKQSAEDYLLGKVYKPKDNKSSNSLAIPLPGKSKDDWMNKVNTKNDSFTRIHEDPLLIIRQNEKKMREKILSNPYKLAKIKNDLENQLKEDDKHKKEKKDKKDKKEKKSKSHRHDNDNEDDDNHYKTNQTKAENNESDLRDRATYRSNDIKRSDSRDRSYRNYERRSYRSRSRSPRYQRDRSRSRNRSPSRKESINNRHDDNSDNESIKTSNNEKKYGLIKGDISKKSSNYLGPNPELLRKKLEDDKLKKEELRRRGEKSNISIEDKERKLKEMEENARLAEEIRLKRLNRSSKEDNSNNNNPTNAQFLNSMRSEVYTSNNTDIGERLLQNKYNSQRSIDIETKSGFHR